LNLSANAQLGEFIIPTAIGGLRAITIIALAAGCVYSILSAIILFILSSLFKTTARDKTPFVEENVKRLKKIGILLIVGSLLLGLTNLIFAFAVFALAYVFQYGTELQRAADETL
jgi:uncharacterized protein YacL